jgi:thiocyanate hydrolase subunit alpha
VSRFEKGDRVRIRTEKTLSHSRVPSYASGRTGVIERVLPDFVIPEDDAWGRQWSGGRRETLYRVRLHQIDTWADYRGSAGDSHELEIFEGWLEPAEEA